MAATNCLLVLWLLLLPAQSSSTSESHNKTLSEVALYIVREHISNLTSTIVIAEQSTMADSANANAQLLDFILQHLHGRTAVQLFYRRYYFSQPLEYYVLIVDSLAAFKKLFHLFEDTPYERHFRFLIFLTKHTPDFLKVMEKIFVLCHHFNVIDVNIITEETARGVSMFTYFHFTDSICYGFLPVRLYGFNEGFEKFHDLFPQKPKNFHGCPLKVSARSYPPYFIFMGNKQHPEPVGNWENISGLEGALLKCLAMALNFTIDLRPFPKENSYIKNNISHGCFEELKHDQVDIAVGGFEQSNDVRWVFSSTGAYHNSDLLFVVRGRNMLSSLGRLAKPFSNQVWILVAVFLVLSIIFISLLKIMKLEVRKFILGEQNHNPVTNFMAVFLGYSVSRTPRRNFARYIFLQMLLLTFILRNAYLGSLYDAFRKDSFFCIPAGYNDLIEWNYTIILPLGGGSNKILKFPKEHTIIVEKDGYEQRLKILEELEGRYVTLAIQDDIFYYYQNKYETDLNFIKEVIYNYQFVMFMKKHSIYLPVFNEKIKKLAFAGMLTKIANRFTKNDKSLTKYIFYQQKKIPLNNKRLYALYSICGILIGIATVVFCLEISSVKYKSLRRILGWII